MEGTSDNMGCVDCAHHYLVFIKAVQHHENTQIRVNTGSDFIAAFVGEFEVTSMEILPLCGG